MRAPASRPASQEEAALSVVLGMEQVWPRGWRGWHELWVQLTPGSGQRRRTPQATVKTSLGTEVQKGRVGATPTLQLCTPWRGCGCGSGLDGGQLSPCMAVLGSQPVYSFLCPNYLCVLLSMGVHV